MMKLLFLTILINFFSNRAYSFQFNTAAWSSCTLPRSSCLAHFKAGCRTSGTYKIRPTSSIINSYCEMNINSGGWTRLNSSMASSTISFGANDVISGNNVGQGCGGTGNNVTFSGITLSHSQLMFIFTRTTTIIQCPGFSGFSPSSAFYLNGGSWVSQNVCTWGNPWTQSGSASDLTTTGLPATWMLTGTHSATTTYFYSQCSNASDNGAYTIQVYMK